MSLWQISCKQRQGEPMELLEFSSMWRAAAWIVRNIRKYVIIVIVRITE